MGVLHGVNAYRSPTKTGCTRSGVHHITARVSDAVDAVLNRLMRFDVAKLQLAAVTRAIMQTVGLSVRMAGWAPSPTGQAPAEHSPWYA